LCVVTQQLCFCLAMPGFLLGSICSLGCELLWVNAFMWSDQRCHESS